MSPIEKTVAAGAAHVAANPLMMKRLNEQNIWEVLSTLPGDYSPEDILAFLRSRYIQFTDLEQREKNMSMPYEPTDCVLEKITVTNPNFAFSPDDFAQFAKDAGAVLGEAAPVAEAGAPPGAAAPKYAVAPPGAGAGKFAVQPEAAGAGGAKYEEGAAPKPEEIIAGAEDYMEGYNEWWSDMEGKIFEIQLQGELKSKNNELKAELNRMMEKVKRGEIDPVFYLVALAKVNCSRNGLMFTQYGKRLWRANDEANKVVQDLYSMDPNDLKYPSYLQLTAQRQKEIGTQQQFLIQDMQSLTQNIESTLTSVKGMIGEIDKTENTIIRYIGQVG